MNEHPEQNGWKLFDTQGGFFDTIGPIWRKREGDEVRFGFRAGPAHENGQGVVHGGMLMTLADQTLGIAVRRAAGRTCSTVSLTSEFLSPARHGQWVEAAARITRKGGAVVFVEGEVTADGEVCLTASGIWKILGVP